MDQKTPRRLLRDRYGKEHEFRPLTLAELIEVERRAGGALMTHADNLKYVDALWVLSSSMDKLEADVLPLFDGPSLHQACIMIFASNRGLQLPTKGSKDDLQ